MSEVVKIEENELLDDTASTEVSFEWDGLEEMDEDKAELVDVVVLIEDE